MVIVINHNEISKLQVTCCTCCFTSYSLHCTSITEKAISMVIDKLKASFVEYGCCVGLGNRKTDCIREALAERPSGDFYAFCIKNFRMAGRDAINRLRITIVILRSGHRIQFGLTCYSPGRPSDHLLTPCNRKDAAKHIAAYSHVRFCLITLHQHWAHKIVKASWRTGSWLKQYE